MPIHSVRRARLEEAEPVVDIIREAFPKDVVERTVYGCSGITAYVEALIHASDRVTPAFFVAGTATEVLAVAEVAASDEGVFLSYIGTRSHARSKGLGSRLLLAAAESCPEMVDSRMTLDVFTENVRAVDWYQRVGFEVIGERGWWELELTRSNHISATVSGLPQAEVCHRAFGFSEIILHMIGNSYRIGRLGDRWFRLTSLAALENPDVLAALRSLDPDRKVLALGDMVDLAASRLGTPTMRALRMQAPVRRLQENLAGH